MARKVSCTLSFEERAIKKAELLRAHREKMSSRWPQYARHEKIFRLGLMLKTWRKNGFTYAASGDYVLFYRRLAEPGRTDNTIIYPTREIKYTLGNKEFVTGGDSHLICQDHWVLDCEVLNV